MKKKTNSKPWPVNNPEVFERLKAERPQGEIDLTAAPVLGERQKEELIEYMRRQARFRARSLSFNGMKVII